VYIKVFALEIFVATDNGLCQLFHCSAVNLIIHILCEYSLHVTFVLLVSLQAEYNNELTAAEQ